MPSLLDTTLLIDLLDGNVPESFLQELEIMTLFTTDINVFELFIGCYALDSEKKRQAAERLCAKMVILPLTLFAAKKAAQLQGNLYLQGKPVNATDCLVAGIAAANGIDEIVTRNKKDFLKLGMRVRTY